MSSLASRAAWLVGLVFSLVFLLVGAVALQAFERQYLTQASHHQLAMMRALADALDQKLTVTQEVLAGAARLMTPAMVGDQLAAEQFLGSRTYLRKHLDQGLVLYDTDGRLLAQDPTAAISQWGEAARRAVSSTLVEGRPQVLPAMLGSNGRVGIVLTTPLRDAAGRVSAVLTGCLTLESPEFAGGLASMPVGQTGYFYLLDGQRAVLMHPNPALRLMVLGLPEPASGSLAATGGRQDGGWQAATDRGVPTLSSFVKLPKLGWTLAADYPIEELHAPLRRSLWLGFAALVAALSLTTWLLTWGLRRLLSPIRDLADRMRSVGSGFAEPYVAKSTGEVAQIGAAYNQMLDDLARSEAERQAQEQQVRDLNAALERRVEERTAELARANHRLACSLDEITRMQEERLQSAKAIALSRMVAGLAHELGTPLGNSVTLASAMTDRQRSLKLQAAGGTVRRRDLEEHLQFNEQSMEVVQRNLARVSTLVQRMRELTEGNDKLSSTRLDLQGLVAKWCASRAQSAGVAGVTLSALPGRPCSVKLSSEALERVLDHLLSNALEHAFDAESRALHPPEIQLAVFRDPASAAPCIRFADNGKGIPERLRAHLFDPFAKGAMSQQGAGLGLSIVHHLVTDVLGGSIAVSEAALQGTAWLISLPAADVSCAEDGPSR